jgi:hypothetical protein
MYCLRRLPQLSLGEFQAHWREYHFQFGIRNKACRRYVQYHTLVNDPTRESLAQAGLTTVDPFDGLAVAWFDSLEAFQSSMKDAVVAEALEDEKLFIDHSRSIACLTEERVIIEPQGVVPIVLIECLRRRADMDREAFQRAWLEHAEFGRRAHAKGLLMGYIQNHTLLGEAGGVGDLTVAEPFDGIVTAYFGSVVRFKALAMSSFASEEAYEDEKRFMNHSQTTCMLTRRHVIKDLVR